MNKQAAGPPRRTERPSSLLFERGFRRFFLAAAIWSFAAILLWLAALLLGVELPVAVALPITLIGGRVVPSFTRNWLVKQAAQSLPAGGVRTPARSG